MPFWNQFWIIFENVLDHFLIMSVAMTRHEGLLGKDPQDNHESMKTYKKMWCLMLSEPIVNQFRINFEKMLNLF